MKKSIYLWQILGLLFTGIAGVLLHFLFDFSNANAIVALFSAVNESIWEHLKLLFFPMFLFSFIEERYTGKNHANFWCIKLIGIVSGLLLIPVLYYTINGAFGATPDWVNIAIFFIATAASYLLETKLFRQNNINCKTPKKALTVLWLIALIFVIFTFSPPQIPFFQDPITNGYGI